MAACTLTSLQDKAKEGGVSLQILRAQLDEWMTSSGQQLVQALTFAALDSCPRQLLRTLAAPLRALLDDKSYGSAALGWLTHALTLPDTPGLHTPDVPLCSANLSFTSAMPLYGVLACVSAAYLVQLV